MVVFIFVNIFYISVGIKTRIYEAAALNIQTFPRIIDSQKFGVPEEG